MYSFSFPHGCQPNRSLFRYDPFRVPSLPAQDSKRKRLLVAQKSNRGSLWAHINAPEYERGSNMEVNNLSGSPCWNNDTASRKGLQSQSSHMVNSTLAQQLSQQYFASLMQPPSTGLRDAQPRSVTEQVGRVEFNVARDGTDFLPQIHFPRYPTPTPPIPPTPRASSLSWQFFSSFLQHPHMRAILESPSQSRVILQYSPQLMVWTPSPPVQSFLV